MENLLDSVIIGHVSLDYNIDYLDNQIIEVGGAVIYSSAAAAALGHKVCAVTKIAAKDTDMVKAFVLPSSDVKVIVSKNSTSIRNKYFTADKEKRACTCISQGDAFTIADIPDIPSKIYHFAGLIYGDFESELIKSVAGRGKVALDVQAMLRHVNKDDGSMYFEDWKDKKSILPYIDYLKTDAAEAEIMTGTADRAEAAKILYSWGAKEIIITHNTEVLVYDGTQIYTCPIKARNLSGRSGRGDTTFSAYITERINNGIQKSLLWASATVSAKMEKPGPYRGNRNDIAEYIDKFYKSEL